MRNPCNKAAWVREVVASLNGEAPSSAPKLLEACKARLSQLPGANWHGIRPSDVKMHDVKSVLDGLRKGAPAPVQPKVAPPAPDAYTLAELRQARDYLNACGGSLHRAGELLKAIYTLTKEKS